MEQVSQPQKHAPSSPTGHRQFKSESIVQTPMHLCPELRNPVNAAEKKREPSVADGLESLSGWKGGQDSVTGTALRVLRTIES